MQKKTPSHDFYRNEIDKWILKEAKLRARYDKAVSRGSGAAAARIAPKIKEAEEKQYEIMRYWKFFIYEQQKKEEALCQKTSTEE